MGHNSTHVGPHQEGDDGSWTDNLPDWAGTLWEWVSKDENAGNIGAVLGMIGGGMGWGDQKAQSAGYQGKIPEYTAVREQLPYMPNQDPSSGTSAQMGRRHFTDTYYGETPENQQGVGSLAAAQAAANAQKESLVAQNPEQFAEGGIVGELNRLYGGGGYQTYNSDGFGRQGPQQPSVGELNRLYGAGGTKRDELEAIMARSQRGYQPYNPDQVPQQPSAPETNPGILAMHERDRKQQEQLTYDYQPNPRPVESMFVPDIGYTTPPGYTPNDGIDPGLPSRPVNPNSPWTPTRPVFNPLGDIFPGYEAGGPNNPRPQPGKPMYPNRPDPRPFPPGYATPRPFPPGYTTPIGRILTGQNQK